MVAGIVAVACGVVSVIVVSLISSTLNTILIGALYLYAAEGKVPQLFDQDTLSNAFVRK
jgi:hypothetical protein